MLKEEFEYLVGKYVSDETYKMYNKMYMAVDLSKEEFAKIIDKNNVDELPSMVNARENYKIQLKEIKVKKSLNFRNYDKFYITEEEYKFKNTELNRVEKMLKEAIKNLIPKQPF